MKEKIDFDNSIFKVIIEHPNVFVDNKNVFTKDIFKNKYVKGLLQLVIEYNTKYDGIPTFNVLDEMVEQEYTNEQIKKILLDQLSVIKGIDLPPDQIEFIKNNLKGRLTDNTISNFKENVEKIDAEQLMKISEQLSEINKDNNKWEIANIWDEVENEQRSIIPTKLELIDKYGLAKGEIGLLMAGTGIGKSVFLSFISNEMMLGGYKVLQIVFEGNMGQYITHHRKKLGNPPLSKLKKGSKTPNLKLVKGESNITTTKDIDELIRRFVKSDFIPDAVVIDYVDCLAGGNQSKENWQNDIVIINELEHIAQKHNVAIWSAVQSNRSGLNKPLGLENVTGSIQKLQKATLVLTLNRDEYQQENNTATLQLVKNRFGKLEKSYDCPWNPNTLEITAPITPTIIL